MGHALNTGLTRIGTLKPDPHAIEKGSCWMLGCETLDRDFADFQQYKQYIPALGIPLLRLQAGWAKTEKDKGNYDFAWLDKIVDDAIALGLKCLLETDYGNPIYEGGGGTDLAGGFPTSEIALEAWDAWVAALVDHFGDRVKDWAMWNEPDCQKDIRPQNIADFNIRTAAVIRQHQPDAHIAGLSFSCANTEAWWYWALKQFQDRGAVEWFDTFVYHGYEYNPDDASDHGIRLTALMKRMGLRPRIRQGENGCPSEPTEKFALNNYPWTELTQAKWDLRRYIGDFCTGIPSSVFTICDFNHIGRQINRKGLLMADENHQVIRPKLAYWAIRNMTTLFNDGLTVLPGCCAALAARPAQAFAMERKSDQARQVVYWDRSNIPGEGGFQEHANIVTHGFQMDAPAVIDPLSGAVYEFPASQIQSFGDWTIYTEVTYGDSPLVLADRKMVELE
ncbi:MAG: beta-galactosidase [Victivallales bacterium]|nr:beta-galactosidase [Victivallales bacterium]